MLVDVNFLLCHNEEKTQKKKKKIMYFLLGLALGFYLGFGFNIAREQWIKSKERNYLATFFATFLWGPIMIYLYFADPTSL